jgi:CubicO group peptidase (beta-lactamase class C family)
MRTRTSRHRSLSTRSRAGAALALAMALVLSGCAFAAPDSSPTGSPVGSPTAAGSNGDPAEIAAIQAAVEASMTKNHVRAAIVRVMRGDEPVLTWAWGESMAGVPATTAMHFRSGAVAIPQVATVLLQLVDENTVSLDDPLANWLPDVPNSDRVTLGQLAQMTAGYADYVQDPAFLEALSSDPFRQWQPEELAAFGTAKPLLFEPGTNWAYAHTDYVLLGLALEKITGDPLATLIHKRVLDPLGMRETADPDSPSMPAPALHAFDSERREFLGVPAGTPFIEDSTYWNPSWTLGRGSIQYTDIADMATVIRAIGRGDLLSSASHDLMIAPTLRGRTSAVEGCATCAAQHEFYTFGYGIVISGDWLLQNPQLHGYASTAAYLADDDLTIAVVATYADDAFDPATGEPLRANIATPLFAAIAAVVAPDAATAPVR